jgi:hypothetical protein
MDTSSFHFNVGEDVNNEEHKNYIKALLSRRTCSEVQAILSNGVLSGGQMRDAHSFWTEFGHKIRKKINNDIFLEGLLRKVLPKYSGAGITLYRGENTDRYNQGNIGFCWTESLKVAQMFASGLNACVSGGLLLKGNFSPQQIISGPSAHSVYLGEMEYTIAPSKLRLESIFVLKSYDQINFL